MKMIVFILLLIAPFATATATDLAWDYPTDYETIDGYIVYFTDGTEQFNKTIAKSELIVEGATVTYPGIEAKLNLPYNVPLNFHVTAYNTVRESDPSNVVAYTRIGFVPLDDKLPQGVTINIPEGPVTLNFR